jgi:hypothetical protein
MKGVDNLVFAFNSNVLSTVQSGGKAVIERSSGGG